MTLSVVKLTPVTLPEHTMTTTVIIRQVEAGPPGAPGAPGASEAHTLFALQALSGHRAVIGVGNGQANYADNTNSSHAGRVIGITASAAAESASVVIQSSGSMTEPSWNWTVNGDIFLGITGLLTQTVPTTGAFLQRLGYALTPTSMWIELSEPIFL